MGVISIRIPDDLQRELALAGVKVSSTVKDDLTRLAKRLRARRRQDVLAQYLRPAKRPVAEIVRSAREDH